MTDQEDHLSGLRALNDGNVVATLNALAERAGEIGAKKAVHQSFFLLGIDLEDRDSVGEFRNSMMHMRRMTAASQERKSEIRKSAIGAGFSMVAGIVAAIATTMMMGLSKAAPVAASVAQHLSTLPGAH